KFRYLHMVPAHIVVGIGGIPIQSLRDRIGGNARRDHIGPVGKLFGMNGDTIVYGGVRRHDNRVCRDPHACLGPYLRALAALNFYDVASTIDPTTIRREGG